MNLKRLHQPLFNTQQKNIANDYLKYEDMTLVMVGDKAAIEKQKDAIEKSRKLK